jgi:hypothetical protein
VAAIEDVCTACGERNPAGSAFCLYCGVYLGWDQAGTAERPREGRVVPAQAAAPEAPTEDFAPSSAPPRREQPTVEWKPGEAPCPQCGHPNGSTLRFCGKCGHALRPGQSATRQLTAVKPRQSWWQRFLDPADRKARRDYRRSLPPLYRWRRVLITLGAIAAVLVLLTVIGTDPVAWTKDKWYAVRGTLVVPDQVAYAAVPAQSVAQGYDVAALGSPAVDDAWATAWSSQTVTPLKGCDGQRAAQGMVRLTFKEPVRVRRLDVLAGLPPNDAKRPFLFRPSVLLVMYGAGQCTQLAVKDAADVQQLELDTGAPVNDLTIAVGATYPARADAKQDLTALTTLTVFSRPQ